MIKGQGCQIDRGSRFARELTGSLRYKCELFHHIHRIDFFLKTGSLRAATFSKTPLRVRQFRSLAQDVQVHCYRVELCWQDGESQAPRDDDRSRRDISKYGPPRAVQSDRAILDFFPTASRLTSSTSGSLTSTPYATRMRSSPS
jgi:hypothetical protein